MIELRALDRAFGEYIARRSGDAALGELFARLSAADGAGHAALPLAPGAGDALLQAWNHGDPPWLGTGAQPSFAVVADDRLFLWRHFRHEMRIAEHIRSRLGAPLDHDIVAPALASLDGLSDAQRAAIALAPGRRLYLLCGGPGTGKTTTARALVQLLLALAAPLGWPAEPRVRLGAPTGKAAQRLGESIGMPAETLHRLLGYRPDLASFSAEPLAADLVLVDEASMIDLPTMRALLEALPTSAMLVLIGDPDQLQSVAAGTVLADLTAALAAQGCVAQLSHSFRSAAAWQPLLAAIRAGNTELPPSPIERIGSADAPQAALLAWAQRHGWHRRGRWQTAAAIASLREAQILCALRAGPTGSEALSAMLDDWLRRDAGSAEPWYPGRVVMFTRNDLATGLNNGDLGIAIDIDGALRIATGDERQPRLLAPGELPEHQPAFAITVHKSQGSEYRHIALVLPPRPDHPLLTRQLLYTALSRARESVALLGDEAALAAAVARPAERIGGLRLRIAGA